MGLEEFPLIEFCDTDTEGWRVRKLVALSGVAAFRQVGKPEGVESLALAFGVLLRR